MEQVLGEVDRFGTKVVKATGGKKYVKWCTQLKSAAQQ